MSLGGVHRYVILKGQWDSWPPIPFKDPEETNWQPKFSGETAPENKSKGWYQAVRGFKDICEICFLHEDALLRGWDFGLKETACTPLTVGPLQLFCEEMAPCRNSSSQRWYFVLFCTEVLHKECRPDSQSPLRLCFYPLMPSDCTSKGQNPFIEICCAVGGLRRHHLILLRMILLVPAILWLLIKLYIFSHSDYQGFQMQHFKIIAV